PGTLLASPLGGRVLRSYSPPRLAGESLGRYSPPRLAGESWDVTRLPAWRASPGRLLASPLGGRVLGGYSPPRLAGESWAVTRLPAWRASPGRLLASPLGGEGREGLGLQPRCERAQLSARAFRPFANCWKEGPRSGIEGQIIGSSGPVYSSRMWNFVEPFPSGASVYVRTPLNNPSGIPPE